MLEIASGTCCIVVKTEDSLVEGNDFTFVLDSIYFG